MIVSPFSKRLLRGSTIFTVLFCFGLTTYAQFDYSAAVELKGLGAVNDDLPFWIQYNQRGRVKSESNFVGILGGKVARSWRDGSLLEAGGGFFFEDVEGKLKVDELFLRYQYKFLELIVGKKHDEVMYDGLSASNVSILRSPNTRPMPGIQLRSIGPIMVLPKAGLGFEFSLNEYLLEEDRYVRDTRLHHKSFHVVAQPMRNLQLKAGLQHYVQWGGFSPEHGPQPTSFEDYVRIFIAWNGGEGAHGGDQQNALGNSLGSYEFILNTRIQEYEISLLWNSIFEDGSGMRLGNTPDGRYGVFVRDIQKKSWVHSFMYEFYYTKHQSHTTPGIHKYDNYFNNEVYKSGWTFHGNAIGVPFFTARSSGLGINNNVFTAHHLGISGVAFGVFPYRLFNSYRTNYGISNMNFTSFSKNPPEEILSSMLEITLPINPVQLNLQVGSDFSKDAGPNLGAGISLYYRLY